MPNLIAQPPIQNTITDGKTNDTAWVNWFQRVFYVVFAQSQSGTTAQRPTKIMWVGRRYFDTTLGKPVYFKSSGVWVDGVGTVS